MKLLRIRARRPFFFPTADDTSYLGRVGHCFGNHSSRVAFPLKPPRLAYENLAFRFLSARFRTFFRLAFNFSPLPLPCLRRHPWRFLGLPPSISPYFLFERYRSPGLDGCRRQSMIFGWSVVIF